MPQKKTDSFNFGGVDSRSNPANYPAERLLRCKNFSPMVSGQLRLRYGFTNPLLNQINGQAIHTAAYYERYQGDQFVLYGQGTALKQVAIATSAVTAVGTFFNSNPWGHFRAANRIFFGNGTDMQNWDGVTLRATGIRAPTAGEVAPVTAVASNVSTGTFATSLLSLASPGYQAYICYFNPVTGHVGNRLAVGARVVFNTAGYSLVLSGLPDLRPLSPELVIGVGRTNDGGQVPYWFINTLTGNRVVVSGGAPTATISDPSIDTTQELPFRNGVPITGLNKFAKVGSKIFGARAGDINLYYTEDDTDLSSGNFVGIPAESWPPDNVEPFPTAEVPQAIHAYQNELWAMSKNYLWIWSLFMFQQGQNPWREGANVGCAGQRAWIETPYGPHWLSMDKQLLGWGGSGALPVSEEYECGLLQKIGDAFMANVELAYYRNSELQIDRIYIKAQDVNGAPLTIIHDFKLRDYRNQIAQGYEYAYSGMTPQTLIGSGFTPRQNVRDVNGREKLWTGAADGKFYQLEDGVTDGGATYIGDAIALINAGDGKPLLDAIEWQGDGDAVVSYSTRAATAFADFDQAPTEQVETDNPDNRFQVTVAEEARWIYARFQLTSKPTNVFMTTDPPFVPMPYGGYINMITPKFGKQRVEAR